MKKLGLILIVVISTFSFSCKHTPTTEEALNCNKVIMDCTSDLDDTYSSFKDVWNEYDLDTYDASAYESLKSGLQTVKDKVTASLKTIESSNKEFEGIPEFTDFSNIAVEYYKALGSMCDNEYTEIISLIGKGDAFTGEDRDKCFANDSIITVKHKNACDKFINFQADFASKFKFELEKKE